MKFNGSVIFRLSADLINIPLADAENTINIAQNNAKYLFFIFLISGNSGIRLFYASILLVRPAETRIIAPPNIWTAVILSPKISHAPTAVTTVAATIIKLA